MKRFVFSKNGGFFLNDKPFRFVGCNMYELANVDTNIAEAMLRDACSQGFKVVRFWAFEPVVKEKIKLICDISASYGLKIIPVLSDTTGYLQSYKINSEWYISGYRKSYLNHIAELAAFLKEREEILLWELINEPSSDSFDNFYSFAGDASSHFKKYDNNHLVSIGTIGGIGDKFGGFFSRLKHSNFEKLYSIKSLDCLSIHDYSFNSSLFERIDILNRFSGNAGYAKLAERISKFINYIPDKIDSLTVQKFGKTIDFPLTLRYLWRNFNDRNIKIAKKLDKPIYVGEVGYKKNLGKLRRVILDIELNNYFNKGFSGVLLWSFESMGKSLDGHDYGFDYNDNFSEIIKKYS